MSSVQATQDWERDWWGTCQNTYGEETKQFVYASRMGLKTYRDGKSPYNFSCAGKILDIGGGPSSMLLKCPRATGAVVDPCKYPSWVVARYSAANIRYVRARAEEMDETGYDEAWIYNVLQHVVDPERVIHNARRAAKIIRLFEWVEHGVSAGHPHNLTQADLDRWLGGIGKVEQVNEIGATGLAYYGIFLGGL